MTDWLGSLAGCAGVTLHLVQGWFLKANAKFRASLTTRDAALLVTYYISTSPEKQLSSIKAEGSVRGRQAIPLMNGRFLLWAPIVRKHKRFTLLQKQIRSVASAPSALSLGPRAEHGLYAEERWGRRGRRSLCSCCLQRSLAPVKVGAGEEQKKDVSHVQTDLNIECHFFCLQSLVNAFCSPDTPHLVPVLLHSDFTSIDERPSSVLDTLSSHLSVLSQWHTYCSLLKNGHYLMSLYRP